MISATAFLLWTALMFNHVFYRVQLRVPYRAIERMNHFSLSLVKPMLGSSKYKTPTNCEPICVANRMQVVFPPESDLNFGLKPIF
jgi:hypothetical protein